MSLKAKATITTGVGTLSPGQVFDAAEHKLSKNDVEVLVAQGFAEHEQGEDKPKGKAKAAAEGDDKSDKA